MAHVKEDVPPGARMGGTPARPFNDWAREVAALKRLASRGDKRSADRPLAARQDQIPGPRRQLAFLGDPLEGLRGALDAVHQIAAFGRQQPQDLVLAGRRRKSPPPRRQIDGLSDLVFVIWHGADPRC